MPNREQLKKRLPLLIGSIPFLAAGLDGIAQEKFLFGLINLSMAAANLVALRFVDSTPKFTNSVLFLGNALVSWMVSYDYFLQGKRGLPYASFVAGLFFLVAAFIFWRKARREES